jgi:hypothetical protein
MKHQHLHRCNSTFDPGFNSYNISALAGKSKVIESGGKHLLQVSGFREIQVPKPRGESGMPMKLCNSMVDVSKRINSWVSPLIATEPPAKTQNVPDSFLHCLCCWKLLKACFKF